MDWGSRPNARTWALRARDASVDKSRPQGVSILPELNRIKRIFAQFIADA